MRRLVVAALVAILSMVLSAQEGGTFRPRWSRAPVVEAVGPVVSFLTPTTSNTYITSATSLTPTGLCAGQSAPCASVSWVNDRGGSGNVIGTAPWSIAPGGAETVGQDTFTGSGSNQELSLHTPNLGPAWSECIDTAGTNSMYVWNGGGVLLPAAAGASQTEAYCMSPTLSGNDYDIAVKVLVWQNVSVDTAVLMFARSGTDSCGIVLGYGVLQFVTRPGGVPTIRASQAVTTAAGDTYLLEKRGNDHTVKQNGVTRLSYTTALCSAADDVGVGYGNYAGDGKRVNGIQLDDFAVTDQGVSGAIPLQTGVNVITFTGTDTAANTRQSVLTVTRSAGDTNDPDVDILDPEPDGDYTTALSSVSLAGTASDDVALASVAYTCNNSCSPASGAVTGTLASWTILNVSLQTGATTFTVTATDSSANDKAVQIVVTRSADVTPPAISIVLPSASTPYTALSATGTISGTASDNQSLVSVTWACDTASPATGTATGLQNWNTATLSWAAGNNTCVLTARDQANLTTTDTIVVAWTPPLGITTTTLQNATQNVSYASAPCIQASGGVAPRTFAVTSGSLPTGVTLLSTGCWSGTPTTISAPTFTVTVTDATMTTDPQVLTLNVVAAGSGPHAYFDMVSGLATKLKCASFRPVVGQPSSSCHFADQLRRIGGWLITASAYPYPNPYMFYDATADAGKHIIPAFVPIADVYSVGPLGISGTAAGGCELISLSGSGTSLGNADNDIKIDNEVMSMCLGPTGFRYNRTTSEGYVLRAQFGTTAAEHTAGAGVYPANNSSTSYVKVPITASADGNTYLYTWDAKFSESYLEASPKGGSGGTMENHKAFMVFREGIGDNRWIEPNTVHGNQNINAACYSETGVFASYGVRIYNGIWPTGQMSWAATNGNVRGPNTSILDGDQLAPRTNDFCFHINRWTRFWLRVEQLSNDWELVSAWMADEVQEPIQILDRRQASVGTATAYVSAFDFRMNTSKNSLRHASQNPLVMWLRNFVVNVDTGLAADGDFSDANMTSTFLVKPLP